MVRLHRDTRGARTRSSVRRAGPRLRRRPAVRTERGVRGGARLHVVHVWHAAPSPHYDDATRSGLKDAGLEALDAQVRAPAEGAGVGCEELVVFGRPERTILDAAEELGADTVALGAEGTSGLEHAPVGSVPEKVLRNANRTVLVVGGHPEGDPEGHAGPGT